MKNPGIAFLMFTMVMNPLGEDTDVGPNNKEAFIYRRNELINNPDKLRDALIQHGETMGIPYNLINEGE